MTNIVIKRQLSWYIFCACKHSDVSLFAWTIHLLDRIYMMLDTEEIRSRIVSC